MPLRVALVTEYYYPDVGGTPDHVFFLGRELRRLGHHVTVLTADFGPEPSGMPNGLPVERLGASAVFISNGSLTRATVGLGLGRRIRAALERGRYDVVHVHSPTFPILPMLAIKHAPPSALLVGTLHTHYEPRLAMRVFAPFIQRYMDALDGVIAVAPSAARSALRHLRFDYRLVPTGVDLETFGRGQALTELDDGMLNVGFVGRLEPRNDVPRLIAAFHEVRRRLDNVRLVLVGDGPGRGELEGLVDGRLRRDVVFAGQQIARRPDYLASCQVFAFTARIAASPVSLREAMAAGCSCVANDIEGCDELIENGREGLLVPRDGVAPLAEALLRLLEHPEERARMGAQARQKAAAFDWPIIARRTRDLYLEWLDARRRGVSRPS